MRMIFLELIIFSLENFCIFRQKEDFLSNFVVEVSDKIFQPESIPVGCVMSAFLVPIGERVQRVCVSRGCIQRGLSSGCVSMGVFYSGVCTPQDPKVRTLPPDPEPDTSPCEQND